MKTDIIICPQCSFEIPVEEVLTRQIRESLGKELEQKLADRIRSESRQELSALQEALSEKSRKLADSQKSELGLLKKTRELEDREKALELEVERRISVQQESLKKSLTKDFQEQLRHKDQLLAERESEYSVREKELAEKKQKLEEKTRELVTEKTKAAEIRIRAELAEESAVRISGLEAELNEKAAKLQEARDQELSLLKKTRELEDREKALELEVERRISVQQESLKKSLTKDFQEQLRHKDQLLAERESEYSVREKELAEKKQKLEEKTRELVTEKTKAAEIRIRAELAEESAVRISGLEAELNEKAAKLQEARDQELTLLKKKRELEDREEALALELERKLNEERDTIRRDSLKQFQEAHELKLKEQEQKMADLTRKLEEAQRSAAQGSQERQGEIQELDLEEKLRDGFRMDEIEPVPKGIRGADVIQTVRDHSLRPCGLIVWESKRTKAWSASWIQKLKDDQIAVGAEIAVIVSEVLPPDIENFGQVDQVWVTTRPYAVALAGILRESLIKLNFARSSAEGMNEKMTILYQYIIGPEFKQKIEAIVGTFENMTLQLEKEKRAMQRIWKEREKQIERVITNTSGMYGDFRGLIGSALEEISAFELGPADTPPRLSTGSDTED